MELLASKLKAYYLKAYHLATKLKKKFNTRLLHQKQKQPGRQMKNFQDAFLEIQIVQSLNLLATSILRIWKRLKAWTTLTTRRLGCNLLDPQNIQRLKCSATPIVRVWKKPKTRTPQTTRRLRCNQRNSIMTPQ